jgi:mono/diheme cytochrome c family protein
MLRPAAVAWLAAVAVVLLGAQARPVADASSVGGAIAAQASGEDIYLAACATCHGPDGKGSSRAIVGFDVPLPDFTDCAFASAEADVDWHAVVHEGGRIRGLDRHMPSFGDALSGEQIDRVVGYVRHFCAEPAWPKGDLNLPRAFFTEKAFPENEVVYTSSVARRADAAVGNEIVYERRFGARNQIEAVVPIDAIKTESGWQSGLGDVALAFRRTFLANNRGGTIAAAGGEVAFPTGNEGRGLGRGYHVFEPFAMLGQTLPGGAFLQLHAGVELPSDPDRAAKEAYFRSAIGVTHLADRGFGRSWSPQLELLFARPAGGEAEWDAVPQLQVSLSKIQHVMVAVGVRVPVNRRDERGTSVVSYLLWDWFDGPFTKFWK